MKQNKSKLIQKIIFALLTAALICFIFSNSTQSRSESIVRSSAVMEFLKPLLDPHNRISDDEFHGFVRKAAHFAEFAALGFSLMGFSAAFEWKKRKQRLMLPLLASLIIAVSDETIQIFSELRGPGVRDVLIDFCGAVFGIACMQILCIICGHLKPRGKTRKDV